MPVEPAYFEIYEGFYRLDQDDAGAPTTVSIFAVLDDLRIRDRHERRLVENLWRELRHEVSKFFKERDRLRREKLRAGQGVSDEDD